MDKLLSSAENACSFNANNCNNLQQILMLGDGKLRILCTHGIHFMKICLLFEDCEGCMYSAILWHSRCHCCITKHMQNYATSIVIPLGLHSSDRPAKYVGVVAHNYGKCKLYTNSMCMHSSQHMAVIHDSHYSYSNFNRFSKS